MAPAAAIGDMDQRHSLASIRSPTLVIAGSQDPATPPARPGHCRRSSGARYVALLAAHLSNIEAAGAFNAAVLDFLLA